MPEQEIPVSNTSKKHFNLNKVMLAVILILVGFAISIALICCYLKFGAPEESTATVVPTNNTATSSAVKDETASWKIYSSNELGVSFKYPKEWDYVELLNSPKEGDVEAFYRLDLGKKTQSSYIEFFEIHKFEKDSNSCGVEDAKKLTIDKETTVNMGTYSNKITRLGNITISGESAYQTKSERVGRESTEPIFISASLESSSNCWSMSTQGLTQAELENNHKTFLTIISTLKFLE